MRKEMKRTKEIERLMTDDGNYCFDQWNTYKHATRKQEGEARKCEMANPIIIIETSTEAEFLSRDFLRVTLLKSYQNPFGISLTSLFIVSSACLPRNSHRPSTCVVPRPLGVQSMGEPPASHYPGCVLLAEYPCYESVPCSFHKHAPLLPWPLLHYWSMCIYL